MSWERRDLLLVVEAGPIFFHLLPLWFFLSKDLLFKVLDHAHELMVLLLCACERCFTLSFFVVSKSLLCVRAVVSIVFKGFFCVHWLLLRDIFHLLWFLIFLAKWFGISVSPISTSFLLFDDRLVNTSELLEHHVLEQLVRLAFLLGLVGQNRHLLKDYLHSHQCQT